MNNLDEDDIEVQNSMMLHGSSYFSPVSTTCSPSEESSFSLGSISMQGSGFRDPLSPFEGEKRVVWVPRNADRRPEEERSWSRSGLCSELYSPVTSRSIIDTSGTSSVPPGSTTVTAKIKLRCGESIFLIPDLRNLFSTTDSSALLKHYLVVEGDRGEDMGSVEEIVQECPSAEFDMKNCSLKKVLRVATVVDMKIFIRLEEEEKEAAELCRQTIKKLDMNGITIHATYFQFDKKKLTFEYISNSYIDFSRLTRILHTTYRCRIWMNQINRNSITPTGVRKALGDMSGSGSRGQNKFSFSHWKKR